jgi:hypothetical protein
VFPVRYELNSYALCIRKPVFEAFLVSVTSQYIGYTQRGKNKRLLQHGSRFGGLLTIPYHSVRVLGTCCCRNLPADINSTFTGTNWRC